MLGTEIDRFWHCIFCGKVQEQTNKYTEEKYTGRGRPPHEEPFYNEKSYLWRDSPLLHPGVDIPKWFIEALEENNWLTVHEFAQMFSTHPTQVRRWCQMGLIHTAWTKHSYQDDTHLLMKHYTFRRLPEDGMTHRRIPASELERCKFLKNRKKGCGRDPRFKIVNGERVIAPELAPTKPKWHEEESESQERLHLAEEENYLKSHPEYAALSEDKKREYWQDLQTRRDNLRTAELNKEVRSCNNPDDIDLSIFEE